MRRWMNLFEMATPITRHYIHRANLIDSNMIRAHSKQFTMKLNLVQIVKRY
jgi:hypothetical protein